MQPHTANSQIRIMYKSETSNRKDVRYFLHSHKLVKKNEFCQNGMKTVCPGCCEYYSNNFNNTLCSETAVLSTTITLTCAKTRVVIQSAVGKPVNVMCFENGSDNLYPNPLIGSQCSLQ